MGRVLKKFLHLCFKKVRIKTKFSKPAESINTNLFNKRRKAITMKDKILQEQVESQIQSSEPSSYKKSHYGKCQEIEGQIKRGLFGI